MDYSNLPLNEKKAKLVELKNKLAELKATQELSGQSKGFESAINKMMDYDPNQAFNLMDRRERIDLEKQRVAQQAQSKTRVAQLEQLWKDTSRALVQARKDRDLPSIAKYEAQVSSLENQLANLSPDTWGNGKTGNVDGDKAKNVNDAINEGYSIVDKAEDNDKDGQIDYVSKMEKDIINLVSKYNISEPDIAPVKTYLQAKKDEFMGKISGARGKAEEGRRNTAEHRAFINDWRSKMKNEIDRLQTVGNLKSSFGNLKDKTNQLNVKKIRLRMASNEAVNDSDIYNANDFNALQQVAQKFGLNVSALTEEGAKQDVEGIKVIYKDLQDILIKSTGGDKVLTDEVNRIIRQYSIPSFGDPYNTTGGLRTGTGGKPSTYPQTKMINGVKWTKLNATSGWKK